MPKERVQKLMARADFGSRRACEKIIEDGRVTVNGQPITLGDQADPDQDDIRVDGQRITLQEFRHKYIVFHKPNNVLSTNKPPAGDKRPTVRSLITVEGHLFTVGRLDAESEGLIVLTNDGDSAHKLAHPSYEHTKTYKVTVHGHPSDETLEEWQNGVWVEGKRTAPCYVKVLDKHKESTTLRIVMIEGRKRQIRRVASQLGHPVQRLLRTHIGQLGLGTLRKGMWYELDEDEVAYMLQPAPELRYIKERQRDQRQHRGKPKSAQPNKDGQKPKPRPKSTKNPKHSKPSHKRKPS